MMTAALLAAAWPFLVPALAETTASEIALSRPENREFGLMPRPAQYVARAAGVAAFAWTDGELQRRGKTKMRWAWRGLYWAGSAYLVSRAMRRW